jgi:putative membrane protein
MTKKFTGIACAIAALCVWACNKGEDPEIPPSKLDRTFMTQASFANNDEVAAGYVATTKAQDASVKAFGGFMVTEHTTAQNDLKAIAEKWSISLPETPDSVHLMLIQKMSMLSGHTFDTAYIKSQLNDHQTAIDLFTQEAMNGENKKLRDYANKYLPHIKMHKMVADSIWMRITH